MSDEAEWTNEFYLREDGTSPVEEFLDNVDERTRGRFGWSMGRLRQENVQAHFPLVRHVEGDLWELREESDKNIYRIIYFFFTGRRIVFLHGFQKKTQRIPRGEIEIAKQRQQEFLAREGRKR